MTNVHTIAITTMSLVDSVRLAGVVGAGGGGFPAHVKLASKAEIIIANGAECEPLLHKDAAVMEHYAAEVVRGVELSMAATGASDGVVGIKAKKKKAVAAIEAACKGTRVRVQLLGDFYPAGDEYDLVYSVTGKLIPPGGLPIHVGAVVNNVETLVNIAQAVDGKPVTHKTITIAGAVAEPVSLTVPIGITFRECIAAAGGVTCDDPVLALGGLMMGAVTDDLDTRVTKTSTGVIVLPRDHVVVRRRLRDWKQMARIGRSACDQCSFCTELCPRYLLGHPIEPHRAMRSLEFNLVGEANVLGTSFCCECNLCSLYSCPEDLDPREVCGHNKRRLAAEKRRWENPPFNPSRPVNHMANRKAPMKRLMQKLGLMGFHNTGPLRDQVLPARRVGIKLKQHVGAPCEPAVAVAQAVRQGDAIGRVPLKDGKAALGCPVHASIDGTVRAIENGVVWIES